MQQELSMWVNSWYDETWINSLIPSKAFFCTLSNTEDATWYQCKHLKKSHEAILLSRIECSHPADSNEIYSRSTQFVLYSVVCFVDISRISTEKYTTVENEDLNMAFLCRFGRPDEYINEKVQCQVQIQAFHYRHPNWF